MSGSSRIEIAPAARCFPLAALRRHARQDRDVIHGPDLERDARKRRGLAWPELRRRSRHPAGALRRPTAASTTDRSTTSASPAPASLSFESFAARSNRADHVSAERIPWYETTSRSVKSRRVDGATTGSGEPEQSAGEPK